MILQNETCPVNVNPPPPARSEPTSPCPGPGWWWDCYRDHRWISPAEQGAGLFPTAAEIAAERAAAVREQLEIERRRAYKPWSEAASMRLVGTIEHFAHLLMPVVLRLIEKYSDQIRPALLKILLPATIDAVVGVIGPAKGGRHGK